MHSIDIKDAQFRLLEVIESLARDGDVVITRDQQPVARLTAPEEKRSFRDFKPVSVGGLLRPFPDPDDDVLGEMMSK